MKIEDGCATVRGYEFPGPLLIQSGKAEMRLEASSQDTGLAVLVPMVRHVNGGRSNFSVKEKDEARAPPVAGLSECLHSRFCSGVKVFSSLALVSVSKPRRL